LDVNLKKVRNYLKRKGFSIKVEGKLGLTFSFQGVKASVLKSGLLLLEGAKGKKEALKFFGELKDSW